jgi:hypothetical protein
MGVIVPSEMLEIESPPYPFQPKATISDRQNYLRKPLDLYTEEMNAYSEK